MCGCSAGVSPAFSALGAIQDAGETPALQVFNVQIHAPIPRHISRGATQGRPLYLVISPEFVTCALTDSASIDTLFGLSSALEGPRAAAPGTGQGKQEPRSGRRNCEGDGNSGVNKRLRRPFGASCCLTLDPGAALRLPQAMAHRLFKAQTGQPLRRKNRRFQLLEQTQDAGETPALQQNPTRHGKKLSPYALNAPEVTPWTKGLVA